MRVPEAHAVPVTETLADAVEERQRDGVGLMVGLPEAQGVAVPQSLLECVGEAPPLAVELPLAEVQAERLPDEMDDRELEGQAEGERDAEALPLSEGMRDRLPLGEGLRDPPPPADVEAQPVVEAVGVEEREEEAQGERVGELLPLPLPEGALEPVRETEAQEEGDGEGDDGALAVPVAPLAVALRSTVAVAEGHPVAEGHTVEVPDTLGVPDDDRHREDVAEVVGLRKGVLLPVPRALVETLGEAQPLAVGDRVAEGLAVGEPANVGDPDEDRQLVGEAGAEALGEKTALPEPLALARAPVAVPSLVGEGGAVGVPEAPLARGETDAAPVGDGAGEAEALPLPPPSLFASPEGEAAPVSVAAAVPERALEGEPGGEGEPRAD